MLWTKLYRFLFVRFKVPLSGGFVTITDKLNELKSYDVCTLGDKDGKYVLVDQDNWNTLIECLELAVTKLNDYSRDHERGYIAKSGLAEIESKLGGI